MAIAELSSLGLAADWPVQHLPTQESNQCHAIQLVDVTEKSMMAIDEQSQWALSQYYNVKLPFQHHESSLVWSHRFPYYTSTYIKLMWTKPLKGWNVH